MFCPVHVYRQQLRCFERLSLYSALQTCSFSIDGSCKCRNVCFRLSYGINHSSVDKVTKGTPYKLYHETSTCSMPRSTNPRSPYSNITCYLSLSLSLSLSFSFYLSIHTHVRILHTCVCSYCCCMTNMTRMRIISHINDSSCPCLFP